MVLTINKHPGRCVDCGRDLQSGQGYAFRSPGEAKWSTSCGKYGCVDRRQHHGSMDPDDAAAYEAMREHEESRKPATSSYTQEDLRMEHGHYGK